MKTSISGKISKNNFFFQVYIMIFLYYSKFIEESDYAIHFDKKLTQYLVCLFLWDLVFQKFTKNSWKFLVTLLLLNLNYSSRLFRSHLKNLRKIHENFQ